MRRLFTLLAIVALLAACGRRAVVPVPMAQVTISGSNGTVTVVAEVAATEGERERGLMGRRSLAAGQGMLFLFPSPVDVGFWMKDTLIPLDIAFISHGVISEVASMTPCHVTDCPLTTPAAPYDMALEVNVGFFRSHNLGRSATVTLSTGLPPAS